jgi:hypothetical protein
MSRNIMKIRVRGQYHPPEGDYYVALCERERLEEALKLEWDAILEFQFDDSDTAFVLINPHAVFNMTVSRVYERLAFALDRAARSIFWDIWTVDI